MPKQKKPNLVLWYLPNRTATRFPKKTATTWHGKITRRTALQVVNFFKAHKISTAVAAHFTNAGCTTGWKVVVAGVVGLVAFLGKKTPRLVGQEIRTGSMGKVWKRIKKWIFFKLVFGLREGSDRNGVQEVVYVVNCNLAYQSENMSFSVVCFFLSICTSKVHQKWGKFVVSSCALTTSRWLRLLGYKSYTRW